MRRFEDEKIRKCEYELLKFEDVKMSRGEDVKMICVGVKKK